MKLFSRYQQRKYLIPFGFVTLFAVIGVALLLLSRAATPFASVEPESGTIATATKVTDSKASGSSYIQFGTKQTGGGTLGTGASKALCNGTCTTVSYSLTGIPITVPNAASGPNPQYIYPGIPGNLITNDPSHPVPLVIVLPDGCTGNGSTKAASCFTASPTDGGPAGWATTAATGKFIALNIFANAAGFYDPILYPGIGAGLCSGAPSSNCDQIPEILTAISYMESHYAIDTTRIFVTGGSKGGDASNEVLCDPSIEPQLAGISALSAVFGTTADLKPPANLGSGTCPAMVHSGATSLPDPATGVHPLMMQWMFGNTDGSYGCAIPTPGVDGTPGSTTVVVNVNGTNSTYSPCLNGGGTGQHGYGASGSYVYSQDEQATEIANPAFGCSTATPPTTSIGNGNVKVRTYTGCNSNANNRVETQIVDIKGGCHAYGCNGGDGLGNVSDVIWNFWTTGSTTP